MIIIEHMLYDIRKDVFKKMKDVKEEDLKVLAEAEARILQLLMAARKEGRLNAVKYMEELKPDYLKMLMMLTADVIDCETAFEIGTNEYWTKDPQGAEAMVYYFGLCGMAFMFEGFNPHFTEGIYDTLIPEKLRPAYSRYLKNAEERILNRYLRWQSYNVERLLEAPPEFEDTELAAKLQELGKNIETLDDESLRWVFQKEAGSGLTARCLYGLNDEAVKKVLGSVSKHFISRLGWDRSWHKKNFSENMVISAVEEVSGIIGELRGGDHL